MAVVKVTEPTTGGQAGISADGQTARRIFQVLMDGKDPPAQAQILAVEAASIPRKGDGHPASGLLKCRDVEARAKSLILWEATAAYATDAAGEMPPGQSYGGPETVPAEIEWFTIASEVKVDKDIHGKALVNSVGEPLDPPLTRPHNDPGLRITRNELEDPRAKIKAYTSPPVVNADDFWGYPPGAAKMASIGAPLARGEPNYWRTTYEIHFRDDADPDARWNRRILDAGFHQVIAGQMVAILDHDKKPVTEPYPLNGLGAAVPIGGDHFWHSWKLFKAVAFADLKLSPQELGLTT